ncbi:LysR family transcriptional regulator [Pseudomonas syringae]|uniref:LysR family transcriptional regulator n=1 Tax=Pseudomonas syringae TaxID=317 RepID=UPI0018E62531|nr:LysR family transcriptional regulator [Pseudomonas syringae]MBI6750930.1 LysR family transcriptional regulator [Pseudomonas syringae]MBI6769253.1 LysR family transcriptional regulator [Pseudomonas syringae]MBI6778572.1 LysR family transcriptional regulator [Pseudomonas syringae]MBI6793745.1 LysR family transcriptional regulator [Pseudomonas syringae]MBI6804476.1 LysR family transcriptional regulator [Pseudomonas syringae]
MRNLDLDSLQIFKAVVDFGSITNAASQLNRVQSNITTRVKNLEQRLGVELFARRGGKLTPSQEGALLYQYAERLLSLAAEAESAMKNARTHGVLRIGTLESTAAARLPPLLSTYHERYPEVQVELVSGSTDDLINRVHRGDVETAFVSDPFNSSGLDSAEAFVEELVLITGRNSSVKNARDLRGQTILTFAQGCSYRRIYEGWLETCNVQPTRIMELASYHAITACAAAGTGVAIMPRSVLAAVQAENLVSVLPLPGKIGRTRTRLVWQKGQYSSVMQTLLDELQQGSKSG